MSEVVLDASALLALLREEEGGAKVADVLVGARICAVNLAEVISHFVHNGMPPSEVDAMLHPLPLTVVAADDVLARIAGQLRAKTAGARLSLGDCFCLALATRDGLAAWTADKQWLRVQKTVEVDIMLIR